ncbi:MAG TPA: hypothetical protein VJL29_10530, partial [Thermoguttaceae bacterium]|nr:hypothetical protein [Thermoguttaceae bacterium]
MNIWNKVLLGLIAVALLPLVYFSLVALKTHEHWRSVAVKIEKQIDPNDPNALPAQIEKIKYGDPADESVESLQSVRIALYKYYVNRGRIWRNCAFQGVKGDGVLVGVKAPPEALEIVPDMVLYAFDEASPAQGGCFLGEFKVSGVNKDGGQVQVGLEPTMRPLPKALERINSGKGTWTLCEVMPNDAHGVFAGMTKEQLQAILPAAVVDEYLADGKEGMERKLRDYHVLLKEIDRQETLLLQELESATRHEQYMRLALEDAKRQERFSQAERASLTAELSKSAAERKAALAHEESLDRELKELAAKAAQLIEDNHKVAEEIGAMQSKMTRQVDRRT